MKRTPFGTSLWQWRKLRGLSQEALAAIAGISTRHLGFLEVGRARPSREAVSILGQALALPLRERNALLGAAGFAMEFGETKLEAQEMAHVNRVLGWILAGCEPNGATVLDRVRNILRHNDGWRHQMGTLVDLSAVFGRRPANSLRLLFHPHGLRTVLSNWEDVARYELARLHTELRALGDDDAIESLLRELLEYPGVPREWLLPVPEARPQLVLPMHVRTPLGDARIFSTLTHIGAPRDVTLQEIRVEAFAPADADSEEILARLGGGEAGLPRK